MFQHSAISESPAELVRTPSTPASIDLAYRSIKLERVAASYCIDAVFFFRASKPDWIWNSLTSLSLTCRLFLDQESSPEIVALLSSIGAIATRMPKLQMLNIWHGVKRQACAFKYILSNNQATIAWCGTWELPFEENIISVWQDLAKLRTGNDIMMSTYQRLNSQDITSHAAAIRMLGLSDYVIHSASLEEIARESEFCYIPPTTGLYAYLETLIG